MKTCQLVIGLVVAAILSLSAGCMPIFPEPKVEAIPRTSKEVAGRWSSVRGTRGQSTKGKYIIDGEEYEALWEITKVIGGKIKLQLQLPEDWSQTKVYLAVEKAFLEEPDQPWYYPIHETMLSLLHRAMRQIGELKSEKTGTAIGVAMDMPYDCRVKVIDRENGWFVECVATLIPDG